MKVIRCSWHSGEDGSAAVEASLIIPVLLLLIFSSVEFGRAFWTYNTMLLAVEDAGRYAMTYNHGSAVMCAAQSPASSCPAPSNTPIANCTAWRAQQMLSTYQAPHIAVSVAEDTTSSPPTITVCVAHVFDFIAPQLLPYRPLSLTSQVIVPLI
jgi:Flp pilus assembly protein TadG